MKFLQKIQNIFTNTKSFELAKLGFMQLPTPALMTDPTGTILLANDKFTQLSGYTNRDVVGENMSLLKSGKNDTLFYKKLWSTLLKSREYNFEVHNRCKNGNILLMRENVTKIKNAGQEYFVITLEDITESKKQEQRQLHLATHDPLTGLANRALLRDRYKYAILNAQRTHSKLCIMLCDLNEFKQINDNYGHNVGDNVLKEVADKLSAVVRESDTVSRYGGDEFILILEQVDESHVERIHQLIKEHLSFSFKIEESEFQVTLSTGYACFPTDGMTFEQLVGVADMKMYDAKAEYYGY